MQYRQAKSFGNITHNVHPIAFNIFLIFEKFALSVTFTLSKISLHRRQTASQKYLSLSTNCLIKELFRPINIPKFSKNLQNKTTVCFYKLLFKL